MDFVVTLFSYVLPFLAMIVVLVTVHEWGHYYAARTLGIAVTQFSIGMGPVLWSRRDRNGCEWRVAAFPVGGFVRFLGDRNASSVAAEDGIAGAGSAVPDAERRRYFALRNPWDRAFVIAAGPLVNLLLGLVVISGLYVANGRTFIPPVVEQTVAGAPAELAGILPGDVILSVDGQSVSSFSEVYSLVAMHPKAPLDLVVNRPADGGNERLSFTVDTGTTEIKAFGVGQTVGWIGISAPPPQVLQMDALSAISTGIDDVRMLTHGMLVGIYQIATGQRPLSDMGGPVRMAEMSGHAAQAGWMTFAFLLAAISINLGVMNLIPLPILDGGHLVLCAVEAIRRRPLNQKALYHLQNAGAILLIALMVGVTAGDVASLVTRTVLSGG